MSDNASVTSTLANLARDFILAPVTNAINGFNYARNLFNSKDPAGQLISDARDDINNLINNPSSMLTPNANEFINSASTALDFDSDNKTGNTRRRSSGAVAPLDYYNAPLATRYRMSAATAYQEALANTAHQREVADLQAAGLNPILSTRYGGSAGVSGATVLSSGSGSGYGSSNSDSSNLDFGKVAQIAGTVFGVISAAKTGHISNITQGVNAGKAIGSLFD